MEKHTVSASLTDNTKYMNRALPVKKSFDIIERTLIIGGQNSAFYFIDGFTKDEIMLKLWTPSSIFLPMICQRMQLPFLQAASPM